MKLQTAHQIMENSDIIILLISLLGIALIVTGVLYLINQVDEPIIKSDDRKQSLKDKHLQKPDDPNQRRIKRKQVKKEEIDDEILNQNVRDDTDNNQQEMNEEITENSVLTRKELIKQEKKRAKAEAKALEDSRREAKKEKESKRAAAMREKEIERDIAERLREEEDNKFREAMEMKEKEEYSNWKNLILIEGAGTEESETKNMQNLLE